MRCYLHGALLKKITVRFEILMVVVAMKKVIFWDELQHTSDKFDVNVTVHLAKFLIIKPTKFTSF